MPGFQIGEVFTESLRFVFKQLRAAFILAAVPYGLLLALTIAAFSLFPEQGGMPDLRPDGSYQLEGMTLVDLDSGARLNLGPTLYFQLLMFLLALIVPLPFKVAWLRYTLLGPQHQPVRPGYSFGDREIRFLGYTVGVIAAMLGLALAGGLAANLVGALTASSQVAIVLTLAALIFLLWVTARLYFVFPAAVMDLSGGFRRAWVESRGQGFKLLVLTVMILVVLGIPAIVISALFGVTPIVAAAVSTVLQIVVDAGLWTALGLAYWRATGIPGQQNTPPATVH